MSGNQFDYRSERARHENFVGRTGLLTRLDQLLVEDAADRWVVITGGPGMGKSALLAAWLTRRVAAGAVVPHHFIRRGLYDWDDPAKLVGSLVAQIEDGFPELRETPHSAHIISSSTDATVCRRRRARSGAGDRDLAAASPTSNIAEPSGWAKCYRGTGDVDVNSATQDAINHDGWSAWLRGPSRDQRAPRLRLLYHCDLDRIGTVSMPGAVALRWLTLGRHDPPFGAPSGSPSGSVGSATRPLDDPQVSRAQLRVRWLPDPQRFEIEPVASARRPLHLVDLDAASAGSPATALLTGPTLLAPGACVAVGDRVLLGLELARVHPPDADRLGLVGESEVAWALRDEIRSVAQFGGSALVLGPTGAGKELVARALHRESPRAAGPFVPVNCGALPEALVESALFGHKKGAFTGAEGDKKGLFQAADGGTLFLDELGELPLAVQPKLLRVLQDGMVTPVGANEGRRADVRVLGATHRDLEAQVRAGRLREDLYHRMARHVLRVPSLAERRFDIPEIFVHVLRGLISEHSALAWLWEGGRTWRATLPIGFVADLMRRSWSGNVRELQNVAEQTARLNLHPGDFQAPGHEEGDGGLKSQTLEGPGGPAGSPASLGAVPSSGTEPASTEATEATDVPELLVRAASEALGLAHKTVLKLLPPEVLSALGAEAERERLDDASRTAKLRARAAEDLLVLLEAREFNQSAVAAVLGTSRTTLIKLMEGLDLPRAGDLGADEIARARVQAGGDLDAAARILRVSPSALKKRVTLLNLKGRS